MFNKNVVAVLHPMVDVIINMKAIIFIYAYISTKTIFNKILFYALDKLEAII